VTVDETHELFHVTVDKNIIGSSFQCALPRNRRVFLNKALLVMMNFLTPC